MGGMKIFYIFFFQIARKSRQKFVMFFQRIKAFPHLSHNYVVLNATNATLLYIKGKNHPNDTI